jgi:hypothetical protein
VTTLLRGANILSWVLANGGEVFYTPDGIAFSVRLCKLTAGVDP